MIDDGIKDNSTLAYIPNPRSKPIPAPDVDIQDFAEGHVKTAWNYGFGTGFTLRQPKDGMNFPNELRKIMSEISKNDIDIASGKIITFDPDFCEKIGGYAKGTHLWYLHGDNMADLVVSCIEDNKYNFIEHPEYIDGNKWKWAVKDSQARSGYADIKSSMCINPFATNITIGKLSGSSIITDIYKVEESGMLFSIGNIEFKFVGHISKLNYNRPFSQLQVFLGVSDKDAQSTSDFHRGAAPTVDGYPSQLNDILYYPLFTNSCDTKGVYVPVRKGQYIFCAMDTQEDYVVTKLDLNVRIYPFAKFKEDEV